MNQQPSSLRPFLAFLAALVVLVAVGAVGFWLSEARPVERVVMPPKAGPIYPVHIRRPAGPPRVATHLVRFNGEPATVACSTCHTEREPNAQTRNAKELDEFHQHLNYNHGNLTCLSCHNPNNYDQLQLADRTPVAYEEVMTLCAQCHGPQFRDYQHGSHGGMAGHWDLHRGPRERNNCIDCHDPHQPAFQRVMPVFAPRDRVPPTTADHGAKEPRAAGGIHH